MATIGVLPAPSATSSASSRKRAGWPRALGTLACDIRALLAMSTMLILGTLVWCVTQTPNRILAYADVPTHLNLARRLHDDLHPGLGQLGDYWLPLAHVIELPFVWNDTLWHDGLAGAIPAMGCYLLSVWCIYQLLILATGQRVPAMIAGIAFAANPNVLYLDVLPMFEPAIMASMLLATYLLARWLQGGGYAALVAAAAAVCVATTSRYEMWGFALASAMVVAVAFWQRGDRGPRLRGHVLFYVLLAWYGMALWLLWNLSLSGDALYFLHPSFNKGLSQDRLAPLTKKQLLHATAYVFYAVADNAGPLLIGVGALGLWRAIASLGGAARGLWLYLLAAPVAFDVFYLYWKGTPPILVPQLFPYTSGNVRYGVVAVPLVCVLVGLLARRPDKAVPKLGWQRAERQLAAAWPYVRFLWPAVQAAVLIAVVAQPLLLVQRNFVVSYDEAETKAYVADQQLRVDLGHWLGVNYDGGYILMSTFKGADRIILESGLPDSDFIHDGSQNTWKCALRVPQRWVRWIVLYKGGDGAAALLTSRAVYGGEFFSRITNAPASSSYFVFRRNATPWHPPSAGQCE